MRAMHGYVWQWCDSGLQDRSLLQPIYIARLVALHRPQTLFFVVSLPRSPRLVKLRLVWA